ncbi:MAG: hypothetical protein KDD73_06070 [Anaerolineales bacterium]|nr:hypothetical protein [Anaerolineales bacterium]MCB9128656.1 hypothetical protein [Ardenticatenales bacterium]MCB9172888.1 hypothetical protein [Ardenticatenales bacterium]
MSRRPYDPEIADLLNKVAATPTGWPLIDWVRLHWPRIEFGEPPPGSGAFCFPWPFARIIIKRIGSEDWRLETVAHELVHMFRWRGHLVGSLEQEYDAYLTAAKVRCEWRGWDWSLPDEEAIKHYPLFFGPNADKNEFKRRLPSKVPMYAVMPWQQPYDPLGIASALTRQGLYGMKTFLKGYRPTPSLRRKT